MNSNQYFFKKFESIFFKTFEFKSIFLKIFESKLLVGLDPNSNRYCISIHSAEKFHFQCLKELRFKFVKKF